VVSKFKRKFDRRLKKRRTQIVDFGSQTEATLDRDLFGRLGKFKQVWRFVASWLLLFALLLGCLVAQNQALGGYYQKVSPIPGGQYVEGIRGTFTNANPLYATSDVDSTVSHLLFAGLFTHDDQNELVGDLAESWQVDERGTTYTVRLRPNLTWQDGHKLTAADVAFTYHTIQNPDAQSPLNGSWQNITVTAVDDRIVTFKLANPLSSFIHTLTNGIVPAHILQKVPVADLRSVDFNNIKPVGAGPFAWDAIEAHGTTPETAQIQIGLKPFNGYWKGTPKLKSFVVHAFADEKAMIKAYKEHRLTAVAGLSQLPKELHGGDTVIYNMRLNAATMVFFKTSSGVLSDVKVRQALIKATDSQALIRQLGYSARPVDEPLLRGQVGYNRTYAQAPFDVKAAEQELAAAGWHRNSHGIMVKDGQPLRFQLYANENAEYAKVVKQLATQWRKIGVIAEPVLQNSEDFKTTLATHRYDALLHGITIGSDPDVFAYWDSSQFDVRSANRYNFSEYKSDAADSALQAGRSRLDPALRVIKYQPFLAAWQKDAPAIGLYQPRYLYITRGEVFGLQEHAVNTSIDRLANVDNWMIRTARVTQ
jgi:peptide/nickel transport system substrate-binding protein